MTRYRKKPVEVEAYETCSDEQVPTWLVEAMIAKTAEVGEEDGGTVWYIKTFEGPVKASPGDFIIRGVAGELYPCKPDIFRQTYDVAAPCSWQDDQPDTLEKVALDMYRYVVERNTPDVPGIDMSEFADRLEALGVVVE